MRWPVLLWLGLLLPAAGCRSGDLVEAELRTKDKELRQLKGELQRTELYNEALQHELQSLRPAAVAPFSPELASQTYTLKEIVLGRQTGGYDEDGLAGDSALQVVVEPRDPDGHAIKAPGALSIEVLQINGEGLKTPLSSWQISPEQLRRSWRSGLLSTGYHLVLPWKIRPAYPKLRVTVRLSLADGRVFEADKDVTIRQPAVRQRQPGPVLVPMEPVPVTPEPELPLFMPRNTEPKKPDDAPDSPGPKERKIEKVSTSWRRPEMTPLAEAVQLLPPIPK